MPAKKTVKKTAKKVVKKKAKAMKKHTKKDSAKAKIVGPRTHITIGKTTPLAPVGKKVGIIAHFYPKIGVAVVDVSGTIREGDSIVIRGGSTMLRQRVQSIQIEHQMIQEARSGQSVGLKVSGPVREGDEVYLA